MSRRSQLTKQRRVDLAEAQRRLRLLVIEDERETFMDPAARIVLRDALAEIRRLLAREGAAAVRGAA